LRKKACGLHSVNGIWLPILLVLMAVFLPLSDALLAASCRVDFIIGEKKYLIDGEVVNTDAAPFIENGRTYVPVRYLGDALGASVEWKGETRTVVLTKSSVEVRLVIGSDTITVAGEGRVMDVAPFIRDGRTFLPARYVAEAFGYQVSWDAQEQMVALLAQPSEQHCIVPGDILIITSTEELTYTFEMPFYGEMTIVLGYRDHAGIYVGDGKVVEATESGVVESALSSWVGRPGQASVEILRVDVSDEIREQAVAFAKAQVGEAYDWDWMTLDYADSETEWYCTEIVWAAYKNQGIDLDANSLPHGSLGGVAPQEIYDSDYTHVIATELLPECDQGDGN